MHPNPLGEHLELAVQLALARKEIALLRGDRDRRASELVAVHKTLYLRNSDKRKRAAELVIANKELAFQNGEKEKRALELVRANQYLENLLDHANAPIVVWDPQYRITRFNCAFEALTGLTEAEVLGRGLALLFPPDPEDRAMDLVRKTTAGERMEIVEIDILRADGEVRTVLWNSATLFEPDGTTPAATIAQGQDITRRRRAEAAQRDSEARFHRVFHLAPVMIALSDLEDGRIIDVNGSYCRTLGFTREELVGDTTLRLGIVHPEDRRHLVRLFEREGTVKGMEFPMYSKAGVEIPSLFSGEILELEGRSLLLSMLTDISELKRAEAERHLLNAEVNQMQKMDGLGRMAGGVAHDMNNVLAAILALASAHQLLEPGDTMAASAFTTIRHAAVRGRDMVKRLLNFARQHPAEDHPVDLNALLTEQVRLLEYTTLGGIRVELALAPDLRSIQGDESALANAFMNLCGNAIDAMPEGGTLTLLTRNLDDGRVEAMVGDTGCGMTPEVLAQATDPFFTTKEVGKGTGLGLAVVFTTVKANRGELLLQSEPGRGTQVRLHFPAAAAPDAAPALRPEAALSPEAALAPPAPGLHLLLVDDDDLIRTSTQMVASLLGHTLTVASCGEDAIALVEQGVRPEVVILDLNMPGLGGRGTLPRLRALCPGVPILLATGRPDEEALGLVAATPDVTLLPKPFSVEELQWALMRVRTRA